ncbi:MAG: hypothetical protein J7497_07325, partial [Chitinophagaceae bacterium]|nr:hypothetical protein [Chitinophagaceae bacterium]
MNRRDLVGKMTALASGGFLLSAPSAKANGITEALSHAAVYDVRKYGAKGDGKTNDTIAIQKTIDACAKGGGGVVLFDKGTFLSGGIKLKSHVELHLTSTAVLLGTKNVKDYNHDTNFKQGGGIRSFINADHCDHIAITGTGEINGQGENFAATNGYSVRPYLVYFRSCKDVRITNTKLHNSAVWICWLLQCERVKLEGVWMDNPVSPNRDGIDLDGCRDVHISNCVFSTEDDSIAFKVSEKGFPCRDITVTNCIISSKCAAIRMGPDAIDNIENITISNCVIRNTRLNGIKIQESMGGSMKNITFSNIVMDNVNGPISLRCAGWKLEQGDTAPFEINDSNWENGKIENILFNNIRATTPEKNHAISITGTTKTRPRDITFSNIDITYTGGGTAEQGARREVPDLERQYPEMYIFGDLPAYAMYMHHVSGVVFNNVHFRLQSDDLRPALVCDDVDDLELSGFKVAGTKSAESVIRLQNTWNVFINGSRTLNQTGTFLRVEGSKSKDILLSGNKLNMSSKIVETTGDVPKDAITQK